MSVPIITLTILLWLDVMGAVILAVGHVVANVAMIVPQQPQGKK
jgi:hypothetical protein